MYFHSMNWTIKLLLLLLLVPVPIDVQSSGSSTHTKDDRSRTEASSIDLEWEHEAGKWRHLAESRRMQSIHFVSVAKTFFFYVASTDL